MRWYNLYVAFTWIRGDLELIFKIQVSDEETGEETGEETDEKIYEESDEKSDEKTDEESDEENSNAFFEERTSGSEE